MEVGFYCNTWFSRRLICLFHLTADSHFDHLSPKPFITAFIGLVLSKEREHEPTQAKNISKRYGNHLAVVYIHLHEKGRLMRFLGPNGAGNRRQFPCWLVCSNQRKGRNYLDQVLKLVWSKPVFKDEMLTVGKIVIRVLNSIKVLNLIVYPNLIDRLSLSAFQKQKYGTLSGGQRRSWHCALLLTTRYIILGWANNGFGYQTRKNLFGIYLSIAEGKRGWPLYWPRIILIGLNEADQIYIVDHGSDCSRIGIRY